MVKLDVEVFKHLSSEEFRVLTAIEMGMKNHELVPTPLIERIAQLRHGGVKKLLGNLLKHKLIHHDSKVYDGFHLTYPGYDYLALKTFMKRETIFGVGTQIGVGKESDILLVINDKEEQLALKLHRLGRVSFRAIKQKRDYLLGRKKSNWYYLSRLSALKEFAFMKALYEEGFPVPTPIDCNRHCVLMSLIPGTPFYQVKELKDPAKVYEQCMSTIVKLAQYGLIHGDFNEFNLILRKDESIVMFDFPQMVSTSHKNADMYFDRDVNCIVTFFARRFGYVSDLKPLKLEDIIKEQSLDVKVEASGFSKEMEKEFESLVVLEKDDTNNLSDDNLQEKDDNGDMDEAQLDSSSKHDIHGNEKVHSPMTLLPQTTISATETTSVKRKDEESIENEKIADDFTSQTSSTMESTTTTTTTISDVTGTNASIMNPEYVKKRVKKQMNKGRNKSDFKTAKRNTQKGKTKKGKVDYDPNQFF